MLVNRRVICKEYTCSYVLAYRRGFAGKLGLADEPLRKDVLRNALALGIQYAQVSGAG